MKSYFPEKFRILAACLLFQAFSPALASASSPAPADGTSRKLVHLLDYLAKDYGGAVHDGKIVSESEYKEQLEFSRTALEASKSATELSQSPAIQQNVERLGRLIESKKDAADVARLARSIQAQVIRLSGLELSPKSWPSLERGRELFAQNCVSCHGANGHGDGPAATALHPHPTNFADDGAMKAVSPFQAFNTIRIGVPGTGMAPFSSLSDGETWDLAFFAVSFRYQGQSAEVSAPLPDDAKTLAKLAALSDEDLRKDLAPAALVALRLKSGSGGAKTRSTSTLAFAHGDLDQALDAYTKGNAERAGELALQAYLEGVEPTEARLRAKSRDLTAELEGRMSEVRSTIKERAPLIELQEKIRSAHGAITRSESLLSQAAGTSQFVLFSVIAIFLREGFEALIIVLAMLSVIRAAKAKRATRWVHSGWLAAIGLGFAGWFASGWLMRISGAQRELMEASISLFAVLVLLYMGFWLHRQTEIGRWRQFIHVKIKTALNGRNRIGLSLIAFFAVFREVFETVLFLRAIWLEGGPDSGGTILVGVLVAFVLVLVMGWVLLRTSAKLPIRKLFTVSSAVMIAMAFILTGKGLHSLQESGNLSETAWPLIYRIDFLGLYPTAETLLAQLAVLGLGLALWSYGKRPANMRRTA